MPSLIATLLLLPSLVTCYTIAPSGVSAHTHHHHPSPTSHTVPATVTIHAGTVIGTTTNLPSAIAAVNEYLGIPFAVSPPERFSPPRKVKKSQQTINATAWKPSCIQQFPYPIAAANFSKALFNTPPPEESEDCLYLNVYQPSSRPPPGGRAVLFWIFGGSFAHGSAGHSEYDGSSYAAYEDVIVVTANYRTNVFGFPDAPELPAHERNLGLLDQRHALEWVQRHIAHFGGNPDKVTVFGQSAGAAAVDALLVTYTTEDAPFRAAILESGQYTYRSYPQPYAGSWLKLTDALNCTDQHSNLTCVREAPAATIKNIIETQSLIFNPYPDEATFPANFTQQKESGNYAKVPVMGGTLAEEGRLFTIGQTNLTAFLGHTFGSTAPQIIPEVLDAFPIGTTVGVDTLYDVISNIATLAQFQCSQALWANQSAELGVPTWRYYYNAQFTNWSPLNGTLGVYHTSELPIVFGTYPGGPVNPVTQNPDGLIPSNVPPTAQEEALSKTMQNAWANFAKDPYAGPGWNQVGTFGRQGVAYFGKDGSRGITVVQEDSLDSLCEIFLPQFKAYTGDAYGLP